ncbi:penicillin acylase family protein [Streptomyces sp. M19]
MTITRDKKTGVPHIKGTTREGTEFGAGYAAAQDRLWLMDLFRHVGRGELTSFAGGAPANQGLEQDFFRQAPYTEADYQAQIDFILDHEGERGRQAMADAQAYVDGINAYAKKARTTGPSRRVRPHRAHRRDHQRRRDPAVQAHRPDRAGLRRRRPFGNGAAARWSRRCRCWPPSRSTASPRAVRCGSPSGSATTRRPC